MSLLQKPIVVALLAVLAGVGSSVAVFLRHGPQLLALVAPKPGHETAEPEKDKGWDFWTIEMENLSAELQDEKSRLKKQNEELDQRRARFATELNELEKVRTDITKLREDIDSRIVQVGADELKNLKTLTQTYAKLSPAAASAILQKMDDTSVVKILSLMKPEVVAPIFEQMARSVDSQQAARAAALSDKIRIMRSNKAAATP